MMAKYIAKVLIFTMAAALMMGCAARQPMVPPPMMEPAAVSMDGFVQKVDNFLVIFDQSGSMNDPYKGDTKLNLARHTAALMNHTIPSLDMQAGLRTFGRPSTFATEDTALVYGMTRYSREGFDEGLQKVPTYGRGLTHIEKAIKHGAADLQGSSGQTAVILISDGIDPDDFPIKAARAMKNRYGNRLCIYTVLVGADAQGKELMQDIADAGRCGFATTADTINHPRGMADFVKAVFLAKAAEPKPMAKPKMLDSDADGVADKMDKCPFTPKSAKVDSQGCWVIPLVFFQFDESAVQMQYRAKLNHVAEVMKKNLDLRLNIHGHTCTIGPEDYNRALSRRRARAVAAYLEGKGIPANRMVIQAHGEAAPAVPNDTEAGRSKNRRVEIVPSSR